MFGIGKKSKESVSLKITALVAFVVMVACNVLANVLPIGGNTTKEVSDAYANLFAPIGFTFSIWGVIYLLLGVFCIFQFKKMRIKKSPVSEKTLDVILPYFIATSVLNSLWIVAWHNRQIGLSLLLIILILGCLIKIVATLKGLSYRLGDYVWLRLPFSVYFGWITVAVIANVTTWLVSIGWDGWGLQDSFWTIAIIVIGGLIGLIASERNNDAAYLAVIIWAYIGILAKHVSATEFNGKYEDIIVVLVLVLGVLLYRLYLQSGKFLQKS